MRKKLITARQKESQNNLKEKKKMTKENVKNHGTVRFSHTLRRALPPKKEFFL